MPWNVPIKVNDNTYDVRFEKEPTEQDIADAVQHLKDPERGQSLEEGVQAGLTQGFEQGLSATFLSGPGAIGEALGAGPDNTLLQTGRQVEQSIVQNNPISQENQNNYGVQAAQAIGQAGSMAITAPLGGVSEFRALSMVGKARQLAMIGGLAGASSGEQEATRIGVTDPLERSAMILGTGAIEAASEYAGGYTAELAPFRALTGKGGPAVHFIKHSAGEGFEEILAGVPERGMSKALATQDPNRPGFTVEGQPIYDAWDLGQIAQEGSLGAIAGASLIAAHHLLEHMTPQQQQDTKNVAGLPQQLRKSAYEALQSVTARANNVVPIADVVDAQTASAMRVVIDGQRAQVLEDAAKEAAQNFAPGWQQREKTPLQHTGENQDTFFDQGEWKTQTGIDAQGQPVFAPASNAATLEKDRQDFIRTGDLPEGMQALTPAQPTAPNESQNQIAQTSAVSTQQRESAQQQPAGEVPPGTPQRQGEGSQGQTVAPIVPQSGQSVPLNPASVTPASESVTPAAPDTSAADRAFYGDYKFGEMQRVRQQYPNSPQLVQGIESANGDAGVKAYLDAQEPKAKLREELEPLSPMQIEEKMRSEGVPEVQIARAKSGGALDVTSAFNSILRQRANTPAGEAPKPTPPKPERRQRLITREIVGDILDVIEEHGGLLSATQAQEQMGPEWFEQNRSLYDDVPRLSSPVHNFIYGGKLSPDRMAQILVDEHLRPPGYDVNDLWREISDTSKSRHAQHRASAAQKRTQAGEQKQSAEFDKATASGERAVTSWDIQPGDTLDIEGEKTAVLGIVIEFNSDNHRARIDTKDGERTVVIQDASPGDIILEDGARFGRQRLEEGKAIWVEKVERASEAPDEGQGFGREPLNLLPPEALAAGQLFAPEAPKGTPTARTQPDEFESRLREYVNTHELEDWTNEDIMDAVKAHEGGTQSTLTNDHLAAVRAVETQMRTPAERLRDEPGPAPVAPITQTEMEDREEQNPFADALWMEAQELQKPVKKKNAPPELRRSIWLGNKGNRHVEFQDFIDVEAFSYNAQVKKMSRPKTSDSERKTLAASAAGKFDNLRRAFPGLTDNQLRKASIDYNDAVTAAARNVQEGDVFTAPRFNPTGENLPDTTKAGDIVYAKTATDHTNMPELVDGAPFALTADGKAVIVTDQVHVTLADRQAAEKSGKTTAAEALARVTAQAREALAERKKADARAKGGKGPRFSAASDDLIRVGDIVKVTARDANGKRFTFYAKPGSDSSMAGVATRVFTETTKDGNVLHDVEEGKVANRIQVVQADLIEKEEPMGMSKTYGEWRVVRNSQTRGRTITTGVSTADVQSAKAGLAKILPNVDNAWSGTRAMLEATLRADPEFQREWKDDWQATHPDATRLDANDAFNDYLEIGLDKVEGFTFRGRTYVIADQVAVSEADGNAAGAVRRVLIHEDAHEALDYLRGLNPNVDNTWRAFRNGIDATELDDLAARLYPGLKDWRVDSAMHDDLAHEWWAAKIADIEERGQPAPDTLIGKFLAWLRDAWKSLMGTTIDPDNAALLDFMDAARSARFQAREDAAAKGLRFSKTDGEGDIPPGPIANEINDVPPPDGGQFEPLKRPRYNLWSPTRQKAYVAFNSNPDLPADMRHFTQFLGQETDDVRITQSLQPMIQMSNRRLGSIHGELPQVNEENTALAYADAKAMATRKTFARKYIEEFQAYHSPRDVDGQPLHAGDAAVAVHQLNLIDYSKRLLAATGDAKLWMQMQPFANDLILGDFATMSSAARLLNVRSVMSQNAPGLITATQLMHGAQHDAAAKELKDQGGPAALNTLAKSISSPEVQDEMKEAFDDFIESSDGKVIAAQAETAMTDPGFEEQGYRERAMALMDEQTRAWDQQLDETLKRLDELEQIRKAIDARKAGNIARPSMSDIQRYSAEVEKFANDPVGLQKQMDALKERAKRLLGKLTQADTSHESKDKRRQRVRDHKNAVKVLSADQEAKKLIERYTERNKRVKRDVPPWKSTFADQIKNPKSAEEFAAAVSKQGIAEETAPKLFALADQLRAEREQAKADRAAKQQTPEAQDARLQRMGEQAAKEPTAKVKGAKRLTAQSLITSIAEQIIRTPLNQQQMKSVRQTDVNGDPKVEDEGGHAAPWNREWVAQAFSNAFVEHNIPRAEADAMAEKLSGKFDAIMKQAQVKAATKAAKALDVKEQTIQKIIAAIRSTAIDPLNANDVVKGLADAAGFGGLTGADFQRLAQLDADIQNQLPTLVAKATTEVQRILARVKPPKHWSAVMEQLFIDGALGSVGVMSLNILHPAYIFPRMLMTDLAGILGDAAIAPGKASRAETLKLAGYSFQSLWRARYGMLSDAAFSLKNDAYQTRMIELLSVEHSLYTELMNNWNKLTSGTVAERALALPKVLWLSSDWVRRILSTADQTWGMVLNNYVVENEAMRQMVQKAGMTTGAAAMIVNQAHIEGRRREAAHMAQTNDNAESVMMGRDVFLESLSRGVSAMLGDENAGRHLLETGSKTYEMELGNRKGEDAPWWSMFLLDPNNILEGVVKAPVSSMRNYFEKHGMPVGRAITGFVSVAANIINRSYYLTPLGLGRVLAKKAGVKTKAGGDIFKETMATDAMVRARMYEGIVSTFAMSLLALLKLKWKDEDEYFGVTGNGPTNPSMREAWLKQGHKPGFLEFRDGNGKVMVGIPYTRGGFDHMAMALTTIGALDDMDLDGHRLHKKDFNWGWAYGQQVMGNQMKQAQFFGIRAWAGSVPSSDKPYALAGQAGYLLNPWTPWGGLTKSLFKMYSGAQEQGSTVSAFLSNVPVAQVLTGHIVGPRLNFLGDQIGGQPDDILKKMAERASYAGAPLYLAMDPDAPNADIYSFIVRKGVAPSMPGRSTLESKNGFIDDSKWASYVTMRGTMIKEAIRRRMASMDKAEPADAQREMERISSEATREAKRKLGLK